MKIIENGGFSQEELSIEELNKVNGGFCIEYSSCTGVQDTCSVLVGGHKTCISYTHTISTDQ